MKELLMMAILLISPLSYSVTIMTLELSERNGSREYMLANFDPNNESFYFLELIDRHETCPDDCFGSTIPNRPPCGQFSMINGEEVVSGRCHNGGEAVLISIFDISFIERRRDGEIIIRIAHNDGRQIDYRLTYFTRFTGLQNSLTVDLPISIDVHEYEHVLTAILNEFLRTLDQNALEFSLEEIEEERQPQDPGGLSSR